MWLVEPVQDEPDTFSIINIVSGTYMDLTASKYTSCVSYGLICVPTHYLPRGYQARQRMEHLSMAITGLVKITRSGLFGNPMGPATAASGSEHPSFPGVIPGLFTRQSSLS